MDTAIDSPGGPTREGAASRLLSRFGRITSGQKLIPEIDGLRFLAIGAVFAYHANTLAARARADRFDWSEGGDLTRWVCEDPMTACFAKGYLGVDVFFAISGFILGLPFARHYRQGSAPVLLLPYFARRLSRLEIPYLASLMLAFVAGGIVTGAFPWSHLLASCLYVHGIVFGDHSIVNPVAWSLEVEVQFYCMAPFLACVFIPDRRWVRIAAIIALATVSVVLRTQFRHALEAWHLEDSIAEQLHCFATGFLAVEFYLGAHGGRPRCPPWLCDVLGAMGIAWIFWPVRYPEIVEWPSFMPACLAIFLAAWRGAIFGQIFRNRWIVTVGGMCYSIYLIHFGAMTLVSDAIGPWMASLCTSATANSLVFLFVMVPVAIIPSAAFFLLVERPCMRRDWPQRLIDRLLRRGC
jgi:peptidoglycan/LPS O-acetylase OafA/YrhL